ncbi:MAG: two-component sensor histidine kinase [Alphaproteobacteria bacterium]|nr:two-component sensor histidine kinase [Alphaproteobacteria bacterium]
MTRAINPHLAYGRDPSGRDPSGGDNISLAEAVVAGLTHPVIALDEQDQLVFVNTAAEEFFKASRGILEGMPLSGFIDADHAIFGMIKRSRNSRASVSDQGLDITSPRLGHRLVNIQVSSLHGAGLPQVVVIALQERALAERLRGQEMFRGAARSMTSLSALLAHEIKNPLAGIRGAAELLQQGEGVDAGERQALTGLIVAETDRIAALLTRMEALAGGKAIDRHPVNIHEVIDHCIRLAENSFGKNRTIMSRFDPSLPATEGDRDLLIQSLLNLIKNACEATDNNGTILISTSYNLGARLSVADEGSRLIAPLVVEVTDNGVGISPELRAHIFDPFVTDKSNGSGLGLALVASAIADHGGTIDVSSRPGETSFRIGLPLAASSVGKSKKPAEQPIGQEMGS